MERDIFEREYIILGNKGILWKNFLLLLLTLVLFIGVLFIPEVTIKEVYPFEWFPLAYKILCLIIIPFVIVALYRTWKQIRNPSYMFFANEEGFEIGIGKSIGFVKWSDVERVIKGPFISSQAEILSVFLKRPEKYFPVSKNGRTKRNRMDIPSNYFSKKQWGEIKAIFQRYIKQMDL